jgi:hypothetical protein
LDQPLAIEPLAIEPELIVQPLPFQLLPSRELLAFEPARFALAVEKHLLERLVVAELLDDSLEAVLVRSR